jgi:hypothetical protein
MTLFRSLAFMIWAGFSVVWVVATAILVLTTWQSSTGEIQEIFKERERQCLSRYSEPRARERCLAIMELERFQSRSIAMFNRTMLVLGPPMLGFGGVLFVRRRKSRAEEGKR